MQLFLIDWIIFSKAQLASLRYVLAKPDCFEHLPAFTTTQVVEILLFSPFSLYSFLWGQASFGVVQSRDVAHLEVSTL